MGRAKASAKRKVRDPGLTCRAKVSDILFCNGVRAFDVLVALVDAVIDGSIDFEMRQRGLGPAWDGERDPGLEPVEALLAVDTAVSNAELEFGKGYGRRPARGTAADVAAELDSMKDGRFLAKLSPAQRALRDLVNAASNEVYYHLIGIAPLAEFPPMTPEFEPTGN